MIYYWHMARTGKIIMLFVFGGILLGSFGAFGYLFLSYCRGDDPNNEDAFLVRAVAAEKADEPPRAAEFRQRLCLLNPFVEEYKEKYVRALVRCRDFATLASLTNGENAVKVEFTPEEVRFEKMLADGLRLVEAGSNTAACAVFAAATNLNYYAATPFLIDGELRAGRLDLAFGISRAYLRKFMDWHLLLQTAELAALAGRADLVEAFRDEPRVLSNRAAIIFGYYCDALVAWVNRDVETMKQALLTSGDIKTPIARMMALEVACAGHDATEVESCYLAVRNVWDFMDFRLRAKYAVKRFVGSHFPSGLPIAALGRLSDLVQEDAWDDLELCRVSLLAKVSARTLTPQDLERAERIFPQDRGIGRIRREYERVRR